MTGTEKQIAYANDIMNNACALCDQAIDRAIADIDKHGAKDGLVMGLVTYMTIKKQLTHSFGTVKTAAEMISKKDIVSARAIMDMAEKMYTQWRKKTPEGKAALAKSVAGITLNA